MVTYFVSADEFFDGVYRERLGRLGGLILAILFNWPDPLSKFVDQLIELTGFQQEIFQFKTMAIQIGKNTGRMSPNFTHCRSYTNTYSQYNRLTALCNTLLVDSSFVNDC